AWCSACGFNLDDLSAMNDDARTFRILAVPLACSQDGAAYAQNTGECLAAKTHGRNRAEIGCVLNLAGRMTFETKQRIVAAHANAIVSHTDQTSASTLDFNRDASGFCV